MNRVCEILGIEKPVIQAPMSCITSPELVAAVSNAGGLGVLGVNAGFEKMLQTVEETTEEMRRQVRKTKELTDKPFAMNVFSESFDAYGFSKATIAMCKEEDVKILVVAGAITADEIRALKADGFVIIARDMFPTVRAAQALEEAGADILVATGCDEGGGMPGHSTGTISMVALVADAVKIPVLAAGGIVNEKMAKASAVVGAEGAFVGTRFILSTECRAAQSVKDDILSTHPDDYITFAQMGGGMKWRCTPHKHAKEALAANQNGDMNPPTGSFFDGMYKGDLEAGINTVNNVASLIHSVDSCKVIVDELSAAYIVK